MMAASARNSFAVALRRMAAGLLLVGLALVAAGPVAAQAVAVRSGEHVDFSRLVLDFDASAGWDLGPVPGGYEFRAHDRNVNFDTTRVFDYIPRKRIWDIRTPAPGVLRLLVDCACHVDGFELRRSRIVVDVKDGPAPANGPFTAPLPPLPSPDPAGRKTSAAAPPASPSSGSPSSGSPSPDPDPPASQAANGDATGSGELADVLPLGPPGLQAPQKGFDIAASDRAVALQGAVVDQIARAATQGLVQPARRLPPPTPASRATDRSPDPQPGHVADKPPPDGTQNHGRQHDGASTAGADPAPSHGQSALAGAEPEPAHVRIETAVDRDRPNLDPANVTDEGIACPAAAAVEIADWGKMSGGLPDISAARAGLTGADDRLNPAQALDLARYYTWLGFGVEAQATLDMVPATTPGRADVAALAAMMDGPRPGPAAAALVGFRTCPNAAAMWSVLAGPPLQPGSTLDEAAVSRAFAALPPHLKDLLGPRLIDAYTSSDRVDAALVLRDAMTLSVTAPSIEAAVAEAGIDRARGAPVAAEARLKHALDTTDPDSPEALMALVTARLAAGQVPDDTLAGAIEALAFEHGDSELHAPLVRSLAEARLARDEFLAVRDLLPEVQPADAASGLARRLYGRAAVKAPDEAFLRLVLPSPKGLGESPVDAAARRAVAARLVDMGFAKDALAVLPAERQGDTTARLIAARASLDLGRPAQALDALHRLQGAEAAALTGSAEEALKHYAKAAAAYEKAGRASEAARMALMAKDYASAGALAEPGIRKLAERLGQSGPTAGGEAGTGATPDPAGAADPYVAARRAIEASRGDRTAIDAALGAKSGN